jgi:hypothetical protein
MSSVKGSTTACLCVSAQVRISKKTLFMFMIMFCRCTMIALIWHRWKVMRAGNGMTKMKLLWEDQWPDWVSHQGACNVINQVRSHVNMLSYQEYNFISFSVYSRSWLLGFSCVYQLSE